MTIPGIRLKQLTWHPHISPVDVATATPRQLEAMKVTPSDKKVSLYVRTLVHDPDSYVPRTELFNAIMYVQGGLPRADRELGALVASAVNGCRYCAVVHARQHARLTGTDRVVSAIVLERHDVLNRRDAAILRFAKALSAAPSQATVGHIENLQEAGLEEDEIVDLIHAVAIFGWANRLMHPLGRAEPSD